MMTVTITPPSKPRAAAAPGRRAERPFEGASKMTRTAIHPDERTRTTIHVLMLMLLGIPEKTQRRPMATESVQFSSVHAPLTSHPSALWICCDGAVTMPSAYVTYYTRRAPKRAPPRVKRNRYTPIECVAFRE